MVDFHFIFSIEHPIGTHKTTIDEKFLSHTEVLSFDTTDFPNSDLYLMHLNILFEMDLSTFLNGPKIF